MGSLINLIPFILGALCLGLGLALYFRSIEAKNLAALSIVAIKVLDNIKNKSDE